MSILATFSNQKTEKTEQNMNVIHVTLLRMIKKIIIDILLLTNTK